jgi:GNAT superfamily N-acetyltransferase
MALAWIQESPARWDATKARILGAAAPGVFPSPGGAGDLLPGDWWRAVEDGRVVGYGWMDVNWADGEVLVVVAPDAQGRGIGSFILLQLEQAARARGLNYLYNVIPTAHPQPVRLSQWLERHGYEPAGGGLMRVSVTRVRSGR